MTPDEALANAARLLTAAEVETDRGLMERYEHLADSWISVAGLMKVNDWTSTAPDVGGTT